MASPRFFILALEPSQGYGIARRVQQKGWLRVEKHSWLGLSGAVNLIFEEGGR
jgi:hypothetical protein